jgi:hypothetical protein
MAGVICSVSTSSEVALVAATPKCTLSLSAVANHPVKVKEWGIFFDGTSVTAEPVEVTLARTTDAGTMTTLTPRERTTFGVTVQSVGKMNASSNPTSGNWLVTREIHPQSGYQEKFSFGDEIVLSGGGAIGIFASAPANVNARAEMVFEE